MDWSQVTPATLLATVGLNALLLLLIVLVVWLWRRRQPMTDVKLRHMVGKLQKKRAAAWDGTVPFGGDFSRMRAMQETLADGLPASRTVTALLLGWVAQKQVSLCESPKKHLQSFGDPMQATLCFQLDRDTGKGAEGLLLSLLYGWADETATLQKSEIYSHARTYYDAVDGRLRQIELQGRHGLRAAGEMQPEQKTRRFGFLDEHRQLYTPRGVREAVNLCRYRAWLDQQPQLAPEQWRDAALLGCTNGIDETQLTLAQALADALVDGARAGHKIHSL